MNILIVNGPNINMLGIRQPNIYGNKDYKSLIKYVKEYSKKTKIKIKFFQSNHEGKIIDYLQKKYKLYDGLILNLGALTHYSYSIRDCVMAINIPSIEVHLSDINYREDFRKNSVIKDIVIDSIIGQGFKGYIQAIKQLVKVIK